MRFACLLRSFHRIPQLGIRPMVSFVTLRLHDNLWHRQACLSNCDECRHKATAEQTKSTDEMSHLGQCTTKTDNVHGSCSSLPVTTGCPRRDFSRPAESLCIRSSCRGAGCPIRARFWLEWGNSPNYSYWVPWGLKRFQESGQTHFVAFSCFARRRCFTTGESRQIFLSPSTNGQPAP